MLGKPSHGSKNTRIGLLARGITAMLLAAACPCRLRAEGEAKLPSGNSPAEIALPVSNNATLWSLPGPFDAGWKPPTRRPPPADFDPQRWGQREHTDFYIHSGPAVSARGPQSAFASSTSFDDNVVELRWKMNAAHRAIPTFEVAGCDLLSARDFYPVPRQQLSPAAAPRPGVLQRARLAVSSKIAGVMHSGCD